MDSVMEINKISSVELLIISRVSESSWILISLFTLLTPAYNMAHFHTLASEVD